MRDILEKHDRAILQFSGGKDSLACLEICRPHLDKITVAWVNSGDAFPETLAQMERVKASVPHFQEIKSDQPAQIAALGWPVDILPVENTPYGRLMRGDDRPIMQAYPLCCGTNLWAPMQKFVAESGATLIIRGSKASDSRKALQRPGDVFEGVEIAMPLWDWTDGEVFAFLASRDVAWPDHYKGLNTSLDCRHCTAHLFENQTKLAYLREHHPEVACEVSRRLKIIGDAVRSELAHLEGAI